MDTKRESTRNGGKNPVLPQNFRMTAEKSITQFLAGTDECYDVPIFLTRDQKCFMKNLAIKQGLKAKHLGSGENTQMILYKKEESIGQNLISSKLVLDKRSKLIANKMLEFVPFTEEIDLKEQTSSNKHLPLGLVIVGSVSNFRTINISVPRMISNHQFESFRKSLPIYQHRDQILNIIRNNQVVVIESATGSGKSTQIPQYILEEQAKQNQPCRIIMTEPKRISASSLANRVSMERGESIGNTVGYQIRLESQVSPDSNLIYVTNGVLLRMFMSGKPEKLFNEITTLIIDEAHERDKFCDFLLLCIREFLLKNHQIRVIIMSATVDSKIFSEYFGNCAVLKVGGNSYPVEVKHLEDILKIVGFQPETSDRVSQPVTSQKTFTEPTERNMAIAQSYLEKLESTPDDTWIFGQFIDMIKDGNIPIDLRNSKSGKTCLEIVRDFKLDFEELQLLCLYNDPKISRILSEDSFKAIATSEDRLLLSYYQKLPQSRNGGNFLEDTVDLKLISKLITHLHATSDPMHGILVFLPGYDEIVRLANMIFDRLEVASYELFILHSQMRTKDQINIFDELQHGVRKIILSTNIAESSITVDVTFVIDSGREKMKTFNPLTLVSSLQTQWISKSSAKQRQGRAGRLHPGTVFRMYSKARFENFKDHCEPSFLRDDISDICLQSKMIVNSSETIDSFMNKALTPPSHSSIFYTVNFLKTIKAIDFNESLTWMGRQLADIPLNPRHAKMLIYSIVLRCVDPVLTIVSALSVGDPFILPFLKDDRQRCYTAKRIFEESSYSDHFVLLRIFQKWNEYKSLNQFDGGFCEDNFINSGAMDRIMVTRQKIVAYLRSVKLLPSVGDISSLNIKSNSWPTVKLCIAAGSYPLIGFINKEKGEIYSAIDSKLSISHSSILLSKCNTDLTKKEIASLPGDYMVFEEKNQSGAGRVSAKVITLVTSIYLALVGGTEISKDDDIFERLHDSSYLDLTIDKFIKISSPVAEARMIQEIRIRLDHLIDKFVMNPGRFRTTPHDEILLECVSKLLEYEDEKAEFKVNFENVGCRPRIVTLKYTDVLTK